MSGFTENQASEANERSGTCDRIMTWQAGRDMLPLVGPIAQDIARLKARLDRLHPELEHLEKIRIHLDWPMRSRRYQVEEDIATARVELHQVQVELEKLGLVVLDAEIGLVGFPTLVNERRAYFSWHPGEELLGHWNYADEFVRRLVPTEWTQSEPTRIGRVRSRSRRK